MPDQSVSSSAGIEFSDDGNRLLCVGSWTISGIANIEFHIKSFLKRAAKVTVIDGSDIAKMDSAGALLLIDFIHAMKRRGQRVTIVGLSQKYVSLYALVATETKALEALSSAPKSGNFFYVIGEAAVEKFIHMCHFFSFVGELTTILLELVMRPVKIQWRAILKAVDTTGYQALPIVALMSFLIGIVLAYQLGTQLRNYGAGVFIVDFSGMAVLREFGPLITAIILAGRTSTSFAALIGTMMVNEEIDALKTMGLSPIERLVVPRVLGLLIALPLLVVWADVFGVLGSMVMAKGMFGISFVGFLERFQETVALKQYVLGLMKAPVFALIISGVGCFQGFQVGASAESVGVQTTKSAVQAIFLIIIADAAFSILFSWMGL